MNEVPTKIFDDIEKNDEDIGRTESATRRAAKASLRAIFLNMDVVYLFIALFIFCLIGWMFARLWGFETAILQKEFKDYCEFFLYVIVGVASVVGNLASRGGLISDALKKNVGKPTAEFLKSIFEPKSELKWNCLTTQNTEARKDECSRMKQK